MEESVMSVGGENLNQLVRIKFWLCDNKLTKTVVKHISTLLTWFKTTIEPNIFFWQSIYFPPKHLS